MEDLRRYYNEVFKQQYPNNTFPEFDKLSSDQINTVKHTAGFATYRLREAIVLLGNSLLESCSRLKTISKKTTK